MSTTVKRYGIVVGVDGSAPSNAAVFWAARDAAMRNVPLTLVHMFKTFVPTFPQIPMPTGVAVWLHQRDQRGVHSETAATPAQRYRADGRTRAAGARGPVGRSTVIGHRI